MEKNKNCDNLSTVQRSCRIWDMTNCLQVNQQTAESRHLHTLNKKTYIFLTVKSTKVCV